MNKLNHKVWIWVGLIVAFTISVMGFLVFKGSTSSLEASHDHDGEKQEHGEEKEKVLPMKKKNGV